MAETLADQVAVEEISPLHYSSKVFPKRVGNALPIGYGGFAIGIATHAAYKTVPEGFSLYSLVGYFLGPSSTEYKIHVKVEKVRDTRTFATRRLKVTQIREDGKEKPCLELLADFQVQEAPWLTYSALPRIKYSSPEQSSALHEILEPAVSGGKLSRKFANVVVETFRSTIDYIELKLCPEGVSAQNVMGVLGGSTTTTQDHLAIAEKTTGDWNRARQELSTPGERMAATAFMLDGGLAFLPLTHSNRWLGDAAVCSTLDFAMRIFVPDIDLHLWHLRERQTIAAGAGRTYTEGKVWKEDGTMVASVTQQCILRAKPGATAEKL